MDSPQTSADAPPAGRAHSWKRIFLRAGRTLLLALAGLILMIMLFENRFIYRPAKYPDGDWAAPARAGQTVEDVALEASDRVKLHGWFVRGKDASLTILYFHGNAGNIAHRFDWVRQLTRLPADVFILDYRGYGKSEGSPDEAGLYRDAEAAYRYLVEQRGVDPQRLVIYGKSLGGGPASELAAKVPCGGLILQSTFTSIQDMARAALPFFPAHWFMRTRFDNLEKIRRISAPKLIVHSRGDAMIPHWMAQRLYEAAAEPKRLKLFERSGHNDLVWHQTSALLQTFREFLQQVRGD